MAPALVFRSILVPVDGSASSDRALALALRFVAWDGELIIAHVSERPIRFNERIDPSGGHTTADPESPERDILARASDTARAAGVAFSTVLLNGSAVSNIMFVATNRNVDAIAMGTHGRTGVARMIMGNTAAGVMREASVPIFVVHEQGPEMSASPCKTIVAGLDGSAAASQAARAAVDLALSDDGRVVFVHVASSSEDHGETPAFSAAVNYACAAGVPSERVVLQGEPVDAIVNSAQACHAGMIAIGAPRHVQNPFGAGSTAHGIVRLSHVPVLVVPAPVTEPSSRGTPAGEAASH
jgi:nucleotide-binding universal stress UspA family protein